MLTETYISEIKDLLARFTQDAHEQKINGNKSWTLEIKKRLTRLGENYGYKTCIQDLVEIVSQNGFMT